MHDVVPSLTCGCGRRMDWHHRPDLDVLVASCCGVSSSLDRFALRLASGRDVSRIVEHLAADHQRLWRKSQWRIKCARIHGGIGYPADWVVVGWMRKAPCSPALLRISIAIHCYLCSRVTEPLWSAAELGGGASICQSCFDRLSAD